MKVFWDHGIVVEDGGFRLCLDSTRSVSQDYAGVSHAHADHTTSHKARVIVTPGTASLYHSKNPLRLEYGEKFRHGGAVVSLHNANHVLGSSQFRVEDGEVVAYTGDVRLRPSLFWECEVVECDTLVIEATYGLPEYAFPPLEEVRGELEAFLKQNSGHNVVFGAYCIGKAQEIVRLLNDTGAAPVVHSRIARANRAYEEHGVRLGEWLEAGTPEAEETVKHSFTAVVPAGLLDGELAAALTAQNGRKTLRAACTGWGEAWWTPVNRVFNLSGHADCAQLLEYVEQSGARRVFTVFGFDSQFAALVRKRLGVEARPLKTLAAKLTDWLS